MPATKLTLEERQSLLTKHAHQRERLNQLDEMAHEALAAEVATVMRGQPNSSDGRPRYAIHGLGIMEPQAYRAWSRFQLIARLLAVEVMDREPQRKPTQQQARPATNPAPVVPAAPCAQSEPPALPTHAAT